MHMIPTTEWFSPACDLKHSSLCMTFGNKMYSESQMADFPPISLSSDHRCCFFDAVPLKYTGKPIHFISHTWSRKFSDLIKTLCAHLPSHEEIIWLDIIAINQHPYEERGCLLNEDVANLGKVLKATQDTLFCLDSDCVSLSRIWCLYEVSAVP